MTPEGWREVRLGDLLDGIDAGWSPQCEGYPAGPDTWGVLKLSAVTSGTYLDVENKALPAALSPRPELEVQPGDLLLARANGVIDLVGRTALVRRTRSKLMFSDKILRLRSKAGVAALEYLHAQLGFPPVREALTNVTGGSHMRNISQGSLRDLLLPMPPLPEQRKIAAILSSVDDAIEATEAVIGQLQGVKKAMMAELLTRGLPGRHMKFRMTEIGEVPEEWEVVTVEDIGPPDRPTAQTGPFGAQLRPEDFVDHGVPILRIGNVQWGRLDLRDLDFVSPTKAAQLERFRVVPGDLLFARQGATTGRNALADDRCAGWVINYHIIRVATDHSRCLPAFLMTCFNSVLVQRQVGREKGRGNRDGINTANILAFRLPLPSLEEQRLITGALDGIDAAVTSNERNVEGLRQAKSALMSVLLTGEVRVKPDEDAA